MRKIVFLLLLFSSIIANSQIAISNLPTYNAAADSAWVPGVIGGTTYKIKGGKLKATPTLQDVLNAGTAINKSNFVNANGYSFRLYNGDTVLVQGNNIYLNAASNIYANGLQAGNVNDSVLVYSSTGKIGYKSIDAYKLLKINDTIGFATQTWSNNAHPRFDGTYNNPTWLNTLHSDKIINYTATNGQFLVSDGNGFFVPTTIPYTSKTYVDSALSTKAAFFTASAPLFRVGGLLGINNANTSTTGALTSTDWNRFNNIANNAFINNGNTFSTTATLGTKDNFSLNFITNDLVRGKIDSTGSWVINKPNTALPNNYTVDEDAALQVIGTTASGTGRMAITRIGSNPSIAGNRYNGTAASPSAVVANNPLFQLAGFGYNGTNLKQSAYMQIRAGENYTGSVSGSYYDFFATTNGANTATSSFKIFGDAIALPQTNFWNKLLYVSNDEGKLKVADNSVRNVKDFGALGNGVADDYAAFQAALDAGVKKIIVPEGTYNLSQSINLGGASIEGINAETTILKSTAGTADEAVLFSNGSRTALPNLSTNLAENATTISLASATTLKRGDIIMLVDTAAGSFNAARPAYTNGFFAVVKDDITAASSFEINGYALAALPSATTLLWKITPTNSSVKNVTIQTLETHQNNGIRITYGNLNSIENVKVYGADVEQILLQYCFNSKITNVMAGKHAPDVAQLSYGISVISSQDITIDNVTSSSTRHAVIIAAASQFPPSRTVVVSNSTINAIGNQYAADLHGGTANCTYKNNYINGGLVLGGANHTITGNTITNLKDFECIYVTEAKQINHTFLGNTIVTNKANLTNRVWIGLNINDYTNVYGKMVVSSNNFQYNFLSGNTPTDGVRYRRLSGSTAMDIDFIGNTFKMIGVTLPVINSDVTSTNISVQANNFENLSNVISNSTKVTLIGNKGSASPTLTSNTATVDEFNEWDTYTANRVAVTNTNGRIATTSNLAWDETNARLAIGTTAPSFKFQIESDGNNQQGQYFRNTNSGTSATTSFILANNNSAAFTFRNHSSGHSTWANTGLILGDANMTGGIGIFNSANAPIFFSNNGSERGRFSTGGNWLVNTTTDISNVALNVQTTTKGSMPYPRMTNAQRTALTVDATRVGMHVYQTDGTEGVYVYKSTGWVFAY